MPAAIRIMADAVTGDGSVGSGDTKKLMDMMSKGQLDPNKVLPLFAQALDMRAAGGKEKYLKTQRAQQNFARVGLEDQIINFGKAGGNEGFFRIWKTFAETLKGMSGLVRGLAGAFKGLVRVVEMVGNQLQVVSGVFDYYYSLPDTFQHLATAFGVMALAMMKTSVTLGKKLKIAFFPLLVAFIAIEDLVRGLNGKNSVTKGWYDIITGKDSEGNSKIPKAIKIPTSAENATPFGERYTEGMDEAGFTTGAKLAYKLQGYVPSTLNPTAYKPSDFMSKSNFDSTYNLNINVSGATTFDQKLADELARQTRLTLQPLMLSKEVGE